MTGKFHLKKSAAIMLAFTIAFSGITFMAVTGNEKADKAEIAETEYKTPAAGLSTEIILASINSEDTKADLVSVTSVAKTNVSETESAVAAISASIAQIEAYAAQAYEDAAGYEEALAVYEEVSDILEQAKAAKKAAESAGSYVISQMYVQEVAELVDAAAVYAQETAETAEIAAEEAAQQEIEDTRQALVDYALSFVGVLSYRYGGSSLTYGTDCSGFTMAIYASFGYSLPHSSASQAYCGRSVSVSEIQIGDIVCYSGHVGIYIGNGMIVHAPGTGQKISTISMYYSTIKSIRRIIE